MFKLKDQRKIGIPIGVLCVEEAHGVARSNGVVTRNRNVVKIFRIILACNSTCYYDYVASYSNTNWL